jgi:hypothetical protein
LTGGSAGEEISVWQTVERGLDSAYFQKTGLNAIDAAATGWLLSVIARRGDEAIELTRKTPLIKINETFAT